MLANSVVLFMGSRCYFFSDNQGNLMMVSHPLIYREPTAVLTDLATDLANEGNEEGKKYCLNFIWTTQ